MSVVTRFAPSPTGMLHIGGARTALFNWLFARHHGGKFLLRIEDTDRARSTETAISAIIDGLGWLELAWDGEVHTQSAHMERHAEVAQHLLAQGKAYQCFCTPEELEDMRRQARDAGRTRLYDGRWRDRDPASAPPGIKPVVRAKMPLEGETVIADAVQGEVRVANDRLDDFVLLRGDGSPTYMLSVVVDDHDMGVTHVIRGDDHLTNAFRQSHLFRACGWRPPQFAHIPLIHGPDGAKLSKRHGALGIEAYREMGYLPAALRNYLLRLGWSHGDDEVIGTAQAIEWFGLDAIGRAPARLDFAKMENLNGVYMRQMDDNELARLALPRIEALIGAAVGPAAQARLVKGMPGLKDRAKTLLELAEISVFYCREDEVPLGEKAARLLDREALERLERLRPRLAGLDHWQEAEIDAAVRGFGEAEGVKLGKIAQPLRAALTGSTQSPGLFEVLAVLGREESLRRLDARLRIAASDTT